jgi:hypothetical protein
MSVKMTPLRASDLSSSDATTCPSAVTSAPDAPLPEMASLIDAARREGCLPSAGHDLDLVQPQRADIGAATLHRCAWAAACQGTWTASRRRSRIHRSNDAKQSVKRLP